MNATLICLCHRKDVVSPGEMAFFETKLVDHPPKLALFVNDAFPVVAVDTNTVTIQRPYSPIERISLQRGTKLLHSHEHKDSGILYVLVDISFILGVPAYHRPHTVTFHSSALK